MTLEEFYVEVLRKMNVLAAEEPISAADRDAVADKYVQLHAEYSRRELLPWFDDEDVPDWAADSFAVIVAARLAETFSLPQDRRLELKAGAIQADTVIVGDGQHRDPPDVPATYY